MAAPFIRIYLYFRDHRPRFYLFLIIIFLLILIPASRIRFREDISGMAGNFNGAGLRERVIASMKFPERVVVRITTSDTAATPLPDSLIAAAQRFSDSITRSLDTNYIRSFTGSMNDSTRQAVYRLMSGYLPLFLEEEDYRMIDTLTDPGRIPGALARGYRTLLTPAGFGLKEQILNDPLGLTYLALGKFRSLQGGGAYEIRDGFVMTRDGRNLLLFLTPANPVSETSRNGVLLQRLDRIIGEVVKTSGNSVRIDYFGSIVVASGNAERIKKDVLITLIVSLTLIFLLIGWYFRSWRVPLLGFLPALFGGGLALAILWMVKGNLSSISLGIGSVLLGLIVDYALYLINHFRKKGDMVIAMKEMTLPVFICALTTAGAFLCLVFLQSAVLHDLGWFAALSVLGAAFFSLVILPQFIPGSDLKETQRSTLADRIAAYRFERSPVFLVAIAALVAIGFLFMKNVRFNEDMMALNFVPEKIRTVEKDLESISNPGLKTMYLVATGENREKALQAREQADPLVRKLLSDSIIRGVSGTSGLLFSEKRMVEKIGRWNGYWTTEKRRSVKETINVEGQKLGFRSGAFEGFSSLLDCKFRPVTGNEAGIITDLLSDYLIDGDGLSLVVTVLSVSPDRKEAVYRTFEGSPGVVVLDRQTLTANFIRSVQHDFDLLVRLSMIFVTLLLLLSFGRIETGLATTLPMFVAWLITLGFMGLFGIKFNIFNIIVSSFVFGLGVDYSILMMQGLVYEYQYGTREINSYKSSILLSSVTTLFGVGALFLAHHPALNSIALVSVIGIVSVVLVTFTVQPLLVKWFLLDRLKKGRYPVTFRLMIKSFITWGNIVIVAILQVVLGSLIFLVMPLPRKKKQLLFHRLFSTLSRAYIAVSFPTNRKLLNPAGEDFSKPAVIICNHQSLIETPALLRLHPKILILTNDWVWNSPLFGPVARMASFFNADHGLDIILDQIREKTEEGYSVLIFPEGHRHIDHDVHRFHRGAFYLAEKLQLDILPIVVFGSGEFLGKGEFWGRPSGLTMKILERIRPEDSGYGIGYSERSKRVRRLVQREYDALMTLTGTGHYFRKKLLLNYIFKGPVLEWYLRVKLIIEQNYQRYNELIPRDATVLDLGCGYGFIAHMLSFCAPKRKITGVDFDAEKIRVAQNCPMKHEKLSFECADLSDYPIQPADVMILSDVLHYLAPEAQSDLLKRCTAALNPGGFLLLRDADAAKQKRHGRTRTTELLSTKVVGFNRTAGDLQQLWFSSFEEIAATVRSQGFIAEVLREEKNTSNMLIKIHRKG